MFQTNALRHSTVPVRHSDTSRSHVVRRGPDRRPSAVQGPVRWLQLPAMLSSVPRQSRGVYHDLVIDATIPGSGLSRIVVGEALFSMIRERNTRHSPDDAALRDAGLYADPTKPFLQ